MNLRILSFYYELLLIKDLSSFLFRRRLKVMNMEETIDKIVDEENLSVCRFGDGEFVVMAHPDSSRFQSFNPRMTEKLKEILLNPIDNCLLCIPYFIKSQTPYWFHTRLFVQGFLLKHFKRDVKPYINLCYNYGDSQFSRFYMMQNDKSKCGETVNKLKQIWEGQDVLIIEGEYSRLGVGNDLFDNVRSIKRVLGPAKNAFDKYEELIAEAYKYGKGKLILLALGMTATCLAYDLAKAGYWAIDIGHVDVEYCWWQMGATEKVPIPGKYVNEADKQSSYTLDEDVENEYNSQVIARVL